MNTPLMQAFEDLSDFVDDAILASEEGDWRLGHPERLDRYKEAHGQSDLAGPFDVELSWVEHQILLLALLPKVDRLFGRKLGTLRRTYTSHRPDIDLAVSLFSSTMSGRLELLSAFGSEQPLVKSKLLVLIAAREQDDFLGTELTVSDGLLRRVLGVELGAKSAIGTLAASSNQTLDGLALDDKTRAPLVMLARAAKRDPNERLCVLISGASGSGKTAVAHALAASSGKPVIVVDGATLSSRLVGLERALDELDAEAADAGAALFVDDCELLLASRMQGNRALPALYRWLDERPGMTIFATQVEGMLDTSFYRRLSGRVQLGIPAPKERLQILEQALHGHAIDDMAFLAEKYEFTPAQLLTTVRLAKLSAGSDTLSKSHVEEAAESQLRHHLEKLAVESRTNLRMPDLVLPGDLMRTIESILAAVRNRRRIFEEWGLGERLTTGRGLNMLFRGESGTGKTLTAEILAAELAMPLYRVAIPRIVSKYIGETEQNLEKAFREAEVAGAILLFDEADAIFTKRVEVSSSTDRYSNMEVNLLLQELERFEGIVVLTTNLDAAIDDAFERRLNYKLDFPFPDQTLRQQLWTRLLPPKAPIELDEGELAFLSEEYELTGGAIKNVVVRAAYAAAEANDSINIDHLEAAAIQEYKELGKLIRSR